MAFTEQDPQITWRVAGVKIIDYGVYRDDGVVVTVQARGTYLIFLPSAEAVLAEIEGQYQGKRGVVTVDAASYAFEASISCTSSIPRGSITFLKKR